MAAKTSAFEGTIRPITDEDLPELRAFLDVEMAKADMQVPQDETFYGWKYLASPTGLRISHAAFDGPRMVGFVGVMARSLLLDGKQHLISEAADAFVEQSYRPAGVYRAILTELFRAGLEEGVSFNVGRPNRRAIPGALKEGYHHLRPLEMYTRPLASGYLLARLTDNPLARRVLQLPASIVLGAALLPARVAGLLGLRIERVERFDGRADQLWQEIGGSGTAMVVRDQAYMSWRYCDCPRSYEIFAVYRGERLLGIVVGGHQPPARGAVRDAEIIELITAPEDRGQLAYLLVGRLVEHFTASGFDAVRCFVPEAVSPAEDPLLLALRLHGFVTRHRDQQALLLRPWADAEASRRLIDRGYWRFRGGDTDYV